MNKLGKYENAKERLEKAEDMIYSLGLIQKDYEKDNDKYFKKLAEEIEEMINDIEAETAGDRQIVTDYEQEEYEDEMRSMNDRF